MEPAQLQSRTQSAVPATILTADLLENLGLKADDLPEIQAIAESITTNNPETVAQFGRDVASHTSAYADDLLSQVRSTELGDMGKKLTEIVSIARNIDARGLSAAPSRLPIVGKLFDRVRRGSQHVMAQFETGADQIHALVEEIDAIQGGIAERNAALDEMYHAVMGEYRLLGVHIAAGKIRLGQMQEALAVEKQHIGNDPARAQALMDSETLLSNLDKRIGDLTVLQHSALQSLPAIRMVQANNRLLIDKFHAVREVTIPAWKREFLLASSLAEQKNAVELATAIDETTNDFMRRNAELLRQNSVAAARANQRLVIDVDTLEKVHTNLIKTVEDVMKIQNDGIKSRQAAEAKIQQMRGAIRQRITQ